MTEREVVPVAGLRRCDGADFDSATAGALDEVRGASAHGSDAAPAAEAAQGSLPEVSAE